MPQQHHHSISFLLLSLSQSPSQSPFLTLAAVWFCHHSFTIEWQKSLVYFSMNPMGRSSRGGSGAPTTNNDVVVIDDNPSAQSGAPSGSGAPRDIPLEMLENALENACETLATLATNVIDFSFDSQHVLFSKVNELVRDLREIDRCGKNVNATIPMDVIEVIDKGRNPELCTYQMLESCAEASNVVRGKLSAVEQFRNELEKSLEEARAQGYLPPVKEQEVGKTVGDMEVDTSNGF